MEKIIMIVFLLMNTVSICYSYDLSTLDGLKECKADSNCYACEAGGAVSQCVKLSPYDKELGEINSNKYDWVCNASSKKEICNKSEEYKKKEKTIKLQISGINNDMNITDGNTYYIYGNPTISLSNNTIVTITQPFDGGGYLDKTGEDSYKYQYDYIDNKNIKDNIANG